MNKKKYEKPTVFVEEYQLNEGVAACEITVLFGPDKGTDVCGDYGFGEEAPFSLEVTPFYDSTSCVCYCTAPEGIGYFNKS